MKALLPLLLLFLPVYSLAQVTLSEIMYNPTGVDYYTEYVEIYNLGAESIDLSGWKITDGSSIDTLISHNGSPPILTPFSFALILDSGYWENGNGVYDSVIPGGTLLLTTDDSGLGSGGLANSYSEAVSLLDPTGNPVSTREYLPNAAQGSSEEKILLDAGNDDDNWAFSDSGGTPGLENSRFHYDFDLAVDSLKADFLSPILNDENNIFLSIYLSNNSIERLYDQTLLIFIEKNYCKTEELFAEKTFSYIYDSHHWEEEFPVGESLPGTYVFRAEWDVDDQNNDNNSSVDTCSVSMESHYLLITELMPSPTEDLPGEWIEIYNNSEISLPVSDVILVDAGGRACRFDSLLNGENEFLPEEYYVICDNYEELFNWPRMDSSKVVLAESHVTLNNGGDSLTLFDYTGKPIDRIVYPESISGYAYQRIKFGNTPYQTDWVLSPAQDGGTPGLENPGVNNPGENPEISEIAVVSLSPNPFSPDGDGFEDNLLFSFKFPALTIEATLKLYDQNGRHVATLLKDRLFDGTDEWEWDGRTGLTVEKLYTGLYIYTFEAVNTSGRSWKKKGVFATTGS